MSMWQVFSWPDRWPDSQDLWAVRKRMEKSPTPYGHKSLLAYSLANGEFTYFTYLRFPEKSRTKFGIS